MEALIAVASKHGSTMEMGRRIARNLRRRGIGAVVCPADRVTSLGGYEIVVLGTGVYANKMLPAMSALVYRWGDQLAGRATYLFCSGPLAVEDPSQVALPPDARTLVRVSGIAGARMFGGCMAWESLRSTERATMRMWGAAAGDYRDWDDVDRWSNMIADQAGGRL
ncbi:MAG: flavodoxin domain-containing protein [Bifidobacteriaceae bacterium]|jgi:menaquinone-dependent protoporphyrinogen oxidase|nr:flavodoxin domain-containing protein [Bifidobacteriaceae bacterium]